MITTFTLSQTRTHTIISNRMLKKCNNPRRWLDALHEAALHDVACCVHMGKEPTCVAKSVSSFLTSVRNFTSSSSAATLLASASDNPASWPFKSATSWCSPLVDAACACLKCSSLEADLRVSAVAAATTCVQTCCQLLQFLYRRRTAN